MKINFQNKIYNPFINTDKPYVQNPLLSGFYGLQNDVFERSEISFKGQCATKSFNVKRIKNLRCPVCGLITLTDEQKKIFIADVSQKTGQDLINALEKYEDESIFLEDKSKSKHRSIYRPIKQEAVNIIKALASENPDMKLDELVQLKAESSLRALIEKQIVIIDELEEYIDKNIDSKSELEELHAVINIYKKQIQGKSRTRFERKRFIYAVSNIPSKKHISKDINRIASKMPKSDTEINSFFVKYSQDRTPREIAAKFVHQSNPSTEHLIPRVKNGKNDTNNYIVDCADCNSARGDMDFSIWMEGIDDFEDNLQEYLLEIRQAVDKGELLESCNDYINDIIETIKNLSNGKISLYPPESNDAKVNEGLLKRREIKLQKLNKAFSKQKQDRINLAKEISEYKKYPYFEIIEKYKKIKEEIVSLNKEINSYNKKNAILRMQINSNSKENLSKLFVQINENENKINELREKSRLLEKRAGMIEKTAPCFGGLDEKIKEQKKQIDILNTITKTIEELEEEVKDEKKFLSLKENLEKQNCDLMTENAKIKQNNHINDSDRTKYRQALHYQLLQNSAEEYLTELKKSKRKDTDNIEEIFTIGKKFVDKKLKALMNQAKVIYFKNIETMDKNSAEIQKLDEKLEKIETSKKMIEFLHEQILQQTNGKTYEEVLSEYEDLLNEKRIVEEIKVIEQHEKNLSLLEENISYNWGVLSKLQDYKELSNREFEKLSGEFY